MNVQHFLRLDDLSVESIDRLLDRGRELKQMTRDGVVYEPLKNQTLAMIFSKSSTRTRVSFEVGMRQMGGASINLNPQETQIGRGEPVEDTARVVSSMVDGVMIRTDQHAYVERFAEYSQVPVINGLTDDFHPCQLLADLQTLRELRGNLDGLKIAWVGDGNNVCHSWMNAARLFNLKLSIATPKGYEPNTDLCELNSKHISLGDDPKAAVQNADVVVTDTWASMGQESEKQNREKDFAGFCVDQKLMNLADGSAFFMHCLPAYRGMEVSDSVIEGSSSVVFQQAENRLHAQKALLELLLG